MTNLKWTRRQFLSASAAGVAGAAVLRPGAAAAFIPSGRPVLTHGVQSGDAFGFTARGGAANIWTRADRPGRMLVEVSHRPDLAGVRPVPGPMLTPETDLTGTVRVHGLPPGRTYFRVRLAADDGPVSAPLEGTLVIPSHRDDIRFVWTGDIAGQGWGINPDIGGMRIFDAMRRLRPDLYLCSGDTAYADGPIPETVTLPDGRVWRNLTTAAKSKVAETLAEYRGQYGAAQRAWLIRGLRESRATWKVIANDLPLGLIVGDGPTAFEGVAQRDPGPPLGRELEFAEVLRAAHRGGVTGIVLLTADVHYTAAHHYDPARAAIQDFTPFWEFVSGPANAGAFGPNALDGTFGPQAVFTHAPPRSNASPLEGYQHFGEVHIDRHSRELTVNLRGGDGAVLWSTTLEA